MPLISSSTTGSVNGTRCLATRYIPKATRPGTNITRRFCFRTASSVTARLRLGRTRNAIRCSMIQSSSIFGPKAKIFRLYLFHECDGNSTAPAVRRRTLKLDFRHGPYRGGHVVQPTFGVPVPFDPRAATRSQQTVVRRHSFSAGAQILLDFVLEQRSQIGRHPVQPMQCVIGPHQTIHKSVHLSRRHVHADFLAAASAFGADEPLLRAVFAGPFLDPFRMHPASAATGQHWNYAPTECSKGTSSEAAASESARRTLGPYAERLSDARTKLEAVFNILLTDLAGIQDVEHRVRRRAGHKQNAVNDHGKQAQRAMPLRAAGP